MQEIAVPIRRGALESEGRFFVALSARPPGIAKGPLLPLARTACIRKLVRPSWTTHRGVGVFLRTVRSALAMFAQRGLFAFRARRKYSSLGLGSTTDSSAEVRNAPGTERRQKPGEHSALL